MSETFFAHLESHLQTLPRSRIRESAWERFCALGLPSKADEAYRYLSLQPFYAAPFALPRGKINHRAHREHREEIKIGCLVFVSGRFCEHLSDFSSDSFSWEEGREEHAKERDPLAALSAALAPEHRRLVFHKDPGVPVRILHVQADEAPCLVPLCLELEVRSGVAVHCTFSASAPTLFGHLSLITCILESNSQMYFTDEREDVQGFAFDHVRCRLQEQSSFKSKHRSCGGKLARRSIEAQLLGEGCALDLMGCDQLKGITQMHTHIKIDHLAPHTTSMQRFIGALWDQAQLSFEGKIHIAPGAQKVEAYQRSDSLLLGEGATAKAKPTLDIHADDVKASHGATVAKVDPLQTFYLQSRGIDKEAGKALIARGFCQEIIDA